MGGAWGGRGGGRGGGGELPMPTKEQKQEARRQANKSFTVQPLGRGDSFPLTSGHSQGL